jgi:hypothetical protein
MSAHNGGVDHHVFVVGIARQQSENAIKNPAFRPSAETLMHALPIAETRRQIAPWHTGPEPVQNRFNEQPVIRCRAAIVPLPARQNILDPIPLVVAQANGLGATAHGLRKAQEKNLMVARIVCALLLWAGAAVAQAPPNIQQIADTMVRLCVGGGQTQAIVGTAAGGVEQHPLGFHFGPTATMNARFSDCRRGCGTTAFGRFPIQTAILRDADIFISRAAAPPLATPLGKYVCAASALKPCV